MATQASSSDQSSIGDYIEQFGPLPSSETMFDRPTNPSEIRAKVEKYATVDVIAPNSSNGMCEGSFSTGVAHDPVVYHESHDPEDVVETWLEENPQILRNSSSWAVYIGLTNGHNEDLLEGAKRVLRDIDPDGWKSNQ